MSLTEKALMGMGGIMVAGIGGALALAIALRPERVATSEGFKQFKVSVAVASLIWNIIDPMIKSKFGNRKSLETVRYGIDQLLDILSGIATSESLTKIIGGL